MSGEGEVPAVDGVFSGLIAVHGGKGGCGTSLVAMELAVRAAASGPAAALDFDFGRGDLAGYVQPWPAGHLADALARLERVDADMLRGLGVRRGQGPQLIPQPFSLAESTMPRIEDIEVLLTQAMRAWPRVVVDSGCRSEPLSLATLLRAGRVVLVVTPRVAALRGARRQLALLRQVGLPDARITLVVNRVEAGAVLSPEDCAAELALPLGAALPLDVEAGARADLHGELPADGSQRKPLARALGKLAAHLGLSSPPPTTWWSRLAKKGPEVSSG